MTARHSAPPTNPISCRALTASLKNRIELSKFKTITPPLKSGKNIWLGITPDRRRLSRLIADSSAPLQNASATCPLVKRMVGGDFFKQASVYKEENANAADKNANNSPLCGEI